MCWFGRDNLNYGWSSRIVWVCMGWSYPEAKQRWHKWDKTVTDLVNDIFEAMKSDGLSDECICETHIGWGYFWSDSFLRCFVKQKDNSVWILTVTICPPLSKINSGRYTHVLAMGRALKTTHLLMNTTTERSKIWWNGILFSNLDMLMKVIYIIESH